jgi:hypothetical protein
MFHQKAFLILCTNFSHFMHVNSHFMREPTTQSKLRQCDAVLALVFAAAIFVGGLADFVGLEEDDLGDAFVGVDFGGEGGGVGEFEGDVAFPFRLEGGDVDDDAAAGVGALAEADGEDVAGDAKVFDGAGEGETVGRDDDVVAPDVYEVFGIEILRVNDGRVDVGEEFELVSTADVVAVAGCAVGDDALPVKLFNLA